MDGAPTISVKNLNKSFGGIMALDDVSIDFRAGEVHALMGENGAGKSTLCKIISGAYVPDAGFVYVNGTKHTAITPAGAKELGIGMIYQEFNLVSEMTVYENVFLGKEKRRGLHINKQAMVKETESIFRELNVRLDPNARIRDLSVAYCQLVEIAKTLQDKAKIVIFDEPTAALTADEIDNLFSVIKQLRVSGMTIIYITHRMDEIERITDRVTVMRDGKVVRTAPTKELNRSEIIRLMIGRTLDETFPLRKPTCEMHREKPTLSIRHLGNERIHNISFDLYAGEILGLAGLVGSGRTEVARAVFGVDRITEGKILANGVEIKAGSGPQQAILKGICLVPEDRHRQGLHLGLPIQTNMTLSIIRRLSVFLRVSNSAERKSTSSYIDRLHIKCQSAKSLASSMSGGNQQKVVLAKWLLTDGNILVLDEPTRGVDVGAKKEIYELLNTLRAEGKSIIMISSEMAEIVGMCDRVVCLYEGRVTGILNWEDATQEAIMRRVSGIQKEDEEKE
jgi:ribose transport system ATP-binding protein